MDRAIVDTSTYLDIVKAPKNRQSIWAQNTMRQAASYFGEHPKLSFSALTLFEILDGFYRRDLPEAAVDFLHRAPAEFEVVYVDDEIIGIGAKINAVLNRTGHSIGLVDALIAATAISGGTSLVSANTKHFQKVQEAGFELRLFNWRDAPTPNS